MRYLKNTFRGAPGERIPHDLLNTLANFWNDLTVMNGTLSRRSDGRNTVITCKATAEEEIVPFRIFLSTDTDGEPTVCVRGGTWTVIHHEKIEADLACDREPTGSASAESDGNPKEWKEFVIDDTFEDAGDYSVVLWKYGYLPKCVEANPASLRVSFTKDFSTWKGDGEPDDWDLDRADMLSLYRILGTVTVEEDDGDHTITAKPIQEIEGDIVEYWTMPDSLASQYANTDHHRRTLDYCSKDDKREWGLQLRNVEEIEENCRAIPYFESVHKEDDTVVGELQWIRVDGYEVLDLDPPPSLPRENQSKYRSLMFRDAETSETLQVIELNGFKAADEWKVPYKKENKDNGLAYYYEFEWQYPVTVDLEGSAGDPCGTYPSTSSFVAGFEGGTTAPEGSYAVLNYNSIGITVHQARATVGQPGEYSEYYVPLHIDWNEDPWQNHNRLNGDNDPAIPDWSTTNSGHDGRYLKIGFNWDGDPYPNTAEGIAYTNAGEHAIDFKNGLLTDGTGTDKSVDYSTRKLWASASEETLNWLDMTLTNTNGYEVMDWMLCRLGSGDDSPDWSVYTNLKIGWNPELSAEYYCDVEAYIKSFAIQGEAVGDEFTIQEKPDAGFKLFTVNSASDDGWIQLKSGEYLRAAWFGTASNAGDRSMELWDVNRNTQVLADGTNNKVYVNNLRLMVNNSLTNWIALVVEAGKITFKDQDDNVLGEMTSGESG